MRRRRSKSQIEIEVRQVAYLYSTVGKTPREIHDMLEISEATVTRRLQYAKTAGYLVEKIEVELCGISNDEILQWKWFPLQEALQKKLESEFGLQHLPRITIVPTENKLESEFENKRLTLERIGQSAAMLLHQYLSTTEKEDIFIGVAWGWNLKAMIEAATNLAPVPNEVDGKCLFFPLAGDIFSSQKLENHTLAHSSAHSLAASTLAEDLNNIFRNVPPPYHLYLASPAFIPSTYLHNKNSIKETNRIRSFLEEALPAYKRIFGKEGEASEEGLIAKADMMITGVGNWERSTTRITPQQMSIEERRILERVVVGDLCGKLVAKGEATPEEKALVHRINDRVFTPEPIQFGKCSDKAYRSNGLGGGTMVLAEGEAKAEIIKEIALRSWITNLIVDDRLGTKLLEIL